MVAVGQVRGGERRLPRAVDADLAADGTPSTANTTLPALTGAPAEETVAVNIASVPSDDLSGPVSTVVVGRPWTTWLTLPLLPAMSSVPE